MYEEARGVTDVPQGPKQKQKKPDNATKGAPKNQGVRSDEKQGRRGK